MPSDMTVVSLQLTQSLQSKSVMITNTAVTSAIMYFSCYKMTARANK